MILVKLANHLEDVNICRDVGFFDIADEITRCQSNDKSEQPAKPEHRRLEKIVVVAVHKGPNPSGADGRVDEGVEEDERRANDDAGKDPPIPRVSVHAVVKTGSEDS